MKIEYINNEMNKGINYDWKLIRKEYKKLKCPKEVYNPCYNNFESNYYFVDLSERSIGKTTNWLLFGMVMNKLYGTQIQYIRQTREMIMPKTINDIFDVIKKFGYIEKITNGEYNTIIYKSRRWNYAHINSDGEIDKIANDTLMMCLSIQDSNLYKSSYNAPLGDLIIFDEFSSKYYATDEFIYFLDLIKTIQRDRQSLRIVMLANTIDIHNQYYHELEIFDDLISMQIGEQKDIITSGGTCISVRLVEPNKVLKENKSISNQLYYSFKNPKLNAITGGGWSIADCQRIPKELEFESIYKNLYILNNNKLLRLEIVKNDLGICIYCHKATVTYDDSIIFTCDYRYDNRYIYRLGSGKLLQFFSKIVNENRFYFSCNEDCSFLENYLKKCGLNAKLKL